MTLEKAIPILAGYLGTVDPSDEHPVAKAATLGLEAMKRLKQARDHSFNWDIGLLHTETPPEEGLVSHD